MWVSEDFSKSTTTCKFWFGNGKGKEIITENRCSKRYRFNIWADGTSDLSQSRAFLSNLEATSSTKACHIDYVKASTIMTRVSLPSIQKEDYLCVGCVYENQHWSTSKTISHNLRLRKPNNLSLTIRSYTMQYLFTTNVYFAQVKMLMFYNVQTTNSALLEKMRYTVNSKWH